MLNLQKILPSDSSYPPYHCIEEPHMDPVQIFLLNQYNHGTLCLRFERNWQSPPDNPPAVLTDNSGNEQINKTFGMIFQEYRLKNNITQEKLAEELTKSTKTISQLETRKRWNK